MTYAKGSVVLKTSDNGIAIIDSTELALSNDGSATPADITIHGPDGAGINIQGADLIIRAGAGTGNASGGDISFAFTPVGSSGSTENTPDLSMSLRGDTGRWVMAPRPQGGLVLPLLTTVQINAMSAPEEGQLVFDVTTHKLKIRVAAAWEVITSA